MNISKIGKFEQPKKIYKRKIFDNRNNRKSKQFVNHLFILNNAFLFNIQNYIITSILYIAIIPKMFMKFLSMYIRHG